MGRNRLSTAHKVRVLITAGRSAVGWAHHFATAAIVVSMALVLAACSSGSGKGSGASSGTDSLKTGGTATVVAAGVSSNLDPAKSRLFGLLDGPAMAAIYGTLAYEDPATGKVVMSFLKSVTPSADFKTWMMKLTPGLKFSDGTPFDAAAINYNIKRMADPATVALDGRIASSLTTKVVDDTTLTVSLPRPNTSFPAIIAEALAAIGSPTAMKAEGADFKNKPVGAGPFKLESFAPGDKITLVRNPYYDLFAKGQPYLDRLVFQNLPDTNQQVNAIKTGQAQFGQTLGQGDADSMKNAGANVLVTKTNFGQNIILNNSVAPFNDPVAREAFCLALDRAGVANAMFTGTAPMTNLLQPSSPYYDSKYDLPNQDKAKAQQLFDQLAAAGRPFKATYEAVPTARSQTLAQYLQSSIAQYKNAKVEVKTVPLVQYISDVRSGSYEMTIHNVYPIALMPLVYNYFAADGPQNYFKWKNATASQALAEIQGTTDEAKLKNDYEIVQREILKDNPAYWGAQAVVGFEAAKSIGGVHIINQGQMPLWGALGYVN